MASTVVGTVELIAKIDTGNYKRGAAEIDKANRDIEGSVKNTDSVAKRATSSLAGLAVKGFKIATVAAIGFSAAVAGMTLKGGISRALNIEDAQAKLRGLGHDAKSVENIMTSALDAVRGTAYGLDAAATIAASAVAAGIKPGKELTKYLGTTADAATIAGVSLSEMGSIFNKVQTGQRAYTQELNQLADRGIPIYQWLQKELGLSQEALRDMVSAGELDSATYFKVIQDNIGGAALESGKTTRGAWANMQAAMSRVGAAIVKDIIPRIRDSFGDITLWFDNNSTRIVNAVGTVIETIKRFGTGAVEIGRQVGDYLAPKLQALWRTVQEELIPVLNDLWKNVIKPMLPVIGTALVVALGLAIDAVRVMVGALGWLHQAIKDGNPIILGLIGLFGALALAMAFNAVFNALTVGFNTMSLVTIPRTMASVSALRALVLTPMVMPAIVITAALVAIAMVWNEYRKLQGEITKTNNAISSLNKTMDSAISKGRLTLDQAYKIQNAANYTGKKTVSRQVLKDGTVNYAPGFATGTNFAPGGMSWVGERGPELINLPRGSQVIPNHKLDEAIDNGNSTEWNIGVINISSEVDGDKWLRKLTGNQEITSANMVPTQNYMGA